MSFEKLLGMELVRRQMQVPGLEAVQKEWARSEQARQMQQSQIEALQKEAAIANFQLYKKIRSAEPYTWPRGLCCCAAFPWVHARQLSSKCEGEWRAADGSAVVRKLKVLRDR